MVIVSDFSKNKEISSWKQNIYTITGFITLRLMSC